MVFDHSHAGRFAVSEISQIVRIPDRPGIYQIRCTRNKKVYVGSAVNLRTRWENHLRDLKNGRHHNLHLQQAWNRYGGEAFEFEVLEHVDIELLLGAEQRWIESTGCTNRTLGFNVRSQATSAGDGIGQTWSGFRDPEGNLVTIVNLSDFCRRNHLDFPSMHRLYRGQSKLKSYKGWTHANSVRQRDFVKTHYGYIAPDGSAVSPIRNLAAFCRERGLSATHMVAVARGRTTSHRGWTHARGRKRLGPIQHQGFVAPGGALTRITNLAAFCRACGLCLVHMRELKRGKRRSHKGWTWNKDAADKAFELRRNT